MHTHADRLNCNAPLAGQLRIKGSNPFDTFDASIKPQVNDSPAVERCLPTAAPKTRFSAHRVDNGLTLAR